MSSLRASTIALLGVVLVASGCESPEIESETRLEVESSVGVSESSLQTPTLQQSIRAEQEKGSLTKIGDTAPVFSIESGGGQVFRLDELRGKVVLLNFFATWCGPCIKELPHLQDLWDHYHDREDFALLVVGREETDETISSFKDKQGFTFPIAADPMRSVYSRYASESIPRTYLISRDGTIVYQSIGYHEEEFARLKFVLKSQLKKSN